jgi:hypothetical protein
LAKLNLAGNPTKSPFYLNDRDNLIKMFEESGFENIGKEKI